MATVIDSKNKSIECEKINVHCQDLISASKCSDTTNNTYNVMNGLSSEVPSNNQIRTEESCSPFDITVEDAVLYFKSLNLSKDLSRLQPERTRFFELLRFLKPPQKLQSPLEEEFELIQSIAQCSLDWADKTQCQMLQTIYRKLTGENSVCPNYGPHWQLIGFQGNDPAKDLRGVGLFGLLQFLYLTSEKIIPLGKKLYSVANSETQPFPLAVLSLNITNIVLNVMTSGKLNRECNTRTSVLDVLNSFYAALLVYVLNSWVSQNKTIKDSGYLLKDAERYCSRNVRRVLKDLPQNLLKYKH